MRLGREPGHADFLVHPFDRAAERTRLVSRNRQSPVAVGPAETARRITFTH